jgi:Ras-related GTP-binding protein C/D
VLYLKEVDTMLALVCITRSENFRRKGLINYNIGCLKRALQALVQPEMDLSSGGLVRRVAE